MRLHRSTTLAVALALAATIAASGCGGIGGGDADPADPATEATNATDAADPTGAATTAPVASPEPTEAPATTPAVAATEAGPVIAPDGFQIVTSRESTFSMAVPQDWTDVTNGVTEEMLRPEAEGSRFDETLRALLASPDTFDILAIDLASTSGFASNVNVIDSGPTPAGGTAESLVANLAGSGTASFFDEILADYEATTIEGRPAVTITYLATPVDTQLKGQQVYLLDDNYYVLTYSASPDQFREGLAAQMAASIS